MPQNNSGGWKDFEIDCFVMTNGGGKFDVTGMQSVKETKESVKTAQNYFKEILKLEKAFL